MSAKKLIVKPVTKPQVPASGNKLLEIPAATLWCSILVFTLVAPCFFIPELLRHLPPTRGELLWELICYLFLSFLGTQFVYTPGAMTALYLARRKPGILRGTLLPMAFLLGLYLTLWFCIGHVPDSGKDVVHFCAYPTALAAATFTLYRDFRRSQEHREPAKRYRLCPAKLALKPFVLFCLMTTVICTVVYLAQGLPLIKGPVYKPHFMPLAFLTAILLLSALVYMPVLAVSLRLAERWCSVGLAVWVPALIAMAFYAFFGMDELYLGFTSTHESISLHSLAAYLAPVIACCISSALYRSNILKGALAP